MSRVSWKLPHPLLVRRLAETAGLIALLPVAFVALVGGTIGGGWGEALLGQIGIPIGLALGIALVFLIVLPAAALVGGFCGWLFGRTLRRSSSRR